MLRYSSLFTFLFITIFSLNCFADYSAEIDTGCCVREIIGHKVYLKPTTIHVAKNGIFINLKGNLQAINHLEMDANGVYIDAARLNNNNIVVDDCPKCGDARVLGYCLNSKCPTKKRD